MSEDRLGQVEYFASYSAHPCQGGQIEQIPRSAAIDPRG
jgi:hypothetical protein